MKFLDIVRDANASLLRNKVRSFLTIIAILVGSFAIITNIAINTGVNKFIDDQIAAYGGEGYLTILGESTQAVQINTGLSDTKVREYEAEDPTLVVLDDSDLDKIRQIEGVDKDSVQPARNITIDYITSNQTDKKYEFGATNFLNRVVYATEGGELPDNHTDEFQIAITSELASALGFEDTETIIGKKVELGLVDTYNPDDITTIKVTVTGIVANGMMTQNLVNQSLFEEIYSQNNKYLPARVLSQFYSVEATYDYKKYSEDEIKQKIADAGYQAMTITDIIGMIKSFFDVISIVLNVFGGIALLVAAIGIINTLFMSVQERTREIGLNKALGMSNGRIFLSFALEAAMLGFWGSVIGIFASMGIGNAMNAALHAEGGLLVDYPTFNVVAYTADNLIIITLIIMLIAFIAGTIPALRASKKDPIEALRYE